MVNQKTQQLKGYSLIELVVVVGLVTLLGVGITSVSMTSMLTSGRVKTVTNLRNAGDNASAQIQKLIRNSKSASCSGNSITLINQDGSQTLIELAAGDLPSPGKISSNSASLVPETNAQVVSPSVTCTPTTSSPTLIKILFSLKSVGTSTRPFETATIKFETSVQLRNQSF